MRTAKHYFIFRLISFVDCVLLFLEYVENSKTAKHNFCFDLSEHYRIAKHLKHVEHQEQQKHLEQNWLLSVKKIFSLAKVVKIFGKVSNLREKRGKL